MTGMGRRARRRTYLADEDFSRKVGELVEAVDEADVPYVPVVEPLLALASRGELTVKEIAEHVTLDEQTLAASLARLQDMGMIIASADSDPKVNLTEDGQMMAGLQRAGA